MYNVSTCCGFVVDFVSLLGQVRLINAIGLWVGSRPSSDQNIYD